MLVVMALGGNALLRPGEPKHANAQRLNVAVAARAIAAVAREHTVMVTHENGPHSESDHAMSPYPPDMLRAESEGMIGYLSNRRSRPKCRERRSPPW